MNSRHKKYSFIEKHRLLGLIFILFFGVMVDQGTKIWAQETLARKIEIPQMPKNSNNNDSTETIYIANKLIVVVPNFFNFIYKENPAAAFSITSSLPDWFRRPLLLIISLLASIFFLVWYFRIKNPGALLLTSFALVLAGAIGNLIDRARMGYVIDFLDAHAGFLGYNNLHWPTFNVADSLIICGAIGIVIRTLWPIKGNS
ncbi:signal peptidase II [Sulfobacillus acidophilus]|uniref:Lipoprotein signal peptidase n=1 Tax=Sulfobacillus acidophilus TaxID=53633 RepID=A0ABS3AWJ7_9FIRM|nr:signal peptidase II [Sulfobacillus acidophilus]